MKSNILKENLFYIGVLVFAVTLLVEHLFSVDTEITGFCKGIGVGLLLAGVIKLLTRKKV